MNISEVLNQFGDLVDPEKLQRAVKRPIALCPEDITSIIPSIELGTDGPVLTSLFLLSARYLGEVRLDEAAQTFDFLGLNTVRNMRFELSEHVMESVDGTSASYQVAEIHLLHGLTVNCFESLLSYVGDDRESWLRLVADAIPVSLVLGE